MSFCRRRCTFANMRATEHAADERKPIANVGHDATRRLNLPLPLFLPSVEVVDKRAEGGSVREASPVSTTAIHLYVTHMSTTLRFGCC